MDLVIIHIYINDEQTVKQRVALWYKATKGHRGWKRERRGNNKSSGSGAMSRVPRTHLGHALFPFPVPSQPKLGCQIVADYAQLKITGLHFERIVISIVCR